MDDLAERLAKAIRATGKTQAWVSVRSGVPEETISRIITRDSLNPLIGTLQRLAPVLNVSVGWLLGERVAPIPDAEAEVLRRAFSIMERRTRSALADNGSNAELVGRIAGTRTNVTDAELLALPETPGLKDFPEATWVLRATNDSLLVSGIVRGDLLYVRERLLVAALMQEMVACRLNGKWFVRRLDDAGGELWLRNDDDAYEPIIVREKEDAFFALGVVVGRAGTLA